MMLDILVSDGRVKMAFTALLANHLYSQSLSPGYSFIGAHRLSIWPAVCLDCFLHPDTAAMMTGPYIKSLEGGLPLEIHVAYKIAFSAARLHCCSVLHKSSKGSMLLSSKSQWVADRCHSL